MLLTINQGKVREKGILNHISGYGILRLRIAEAEE